MSEQLRARHAGHDPRWTRPEDGICLLCAEERSKEIIADVQYRLQQLQRMLETRTAERDMALKDAVLWRGRINSYAPFQDYVNGNRQIIVTLSPGHLYHIKAEERDVFIVEQLGAAILKLLRDCSPEEALLEFLRKANQLKTETNSTPTCSPTTKR